MLATVDIADIDFGSRLRAADAEQVSALAASIAEVGLLNPVTLYRKTIWRGGVAGDGYGLIAGLHRIEACKSLGLVEIDASILELSDLERQIAECDENLCGTKLTPAERARFTRRRKEAYEALHPETRHGGDRKSDQVADFATRSFSADQAEKTGAAERTVRLDAERGEKVADEALDLVIENAALNTGVYLDKLKDLPREAQVETVKRDVENKIKASRAIMADRREPDDSLDYFPTPPWATRALLEDVLGGAIGPSARIWEPACGEGHMSGVLLEYSPFVLATDVFDYSAEGRSPPGWDRAVDFLAGVGAGAEADWIITNPPFGDKSLAFILKALDVAQVGVAMFVRTQFLESLERYERLFATRPPTLIAQFAERVPLCKGWWNPDGDTATMYCWLVWQRGWLKGKPDGLQTSFRWIRPGRRIERSRADDVARFVTASPVLPPAPEFLAEAPSIESRAPAGGPVEAGGAVPSASPASSFAARLIEERLKAVLALRPDCLVPECCRSPGGRALCHSCAKAKERGSVDLPAFLPPRPAETEEAS